MIIKEVVVLNEASEDINNGVSFYAKKEEWLGDYFFDSIVSDLESLKIYAGIHSKCFRCYRMMAKRFPFAIYYDLLNKVVLVISVLDMRKNPSWIKKKLKAHRSEIPNLKR